MGGDGAGGLCTNATARMPQRGRLRCSSAMAAARAGRAEWLQGGLVGQKGLDEWPGYTSGRGAKAARCDTAATQSRQNEPGTPRLQVPKHAARAVGCRRPTHKDDDCNAAGPTHTDAAVAQVCEACEAGSLLVRHVAVLHRVPQIPHDGCSDGRAPGWHTRQGTNKGRTDSTSIQMRTLLKARDMHEPATTAAKSDQAAATVSEDVGQLHVVGPRWEALRQTTNAEEAPTLGQAVFRVEAHRDVRAADLRLAGAGAGRRRLAAWPTAAPPPHRT